MHSISEQFGLAHESKGRGDSRFIVVWRDPVKVASHSSGGFRGREVSCLRLPAAAWEALGHPLVVHAAKSGNVEAITRGAPLAAVGPDEVARLLADTSYTMWQEKGNLPRRIDSAGRGPPETPLLPVRKQLPAWGSRAALLTAVAEHQVTLVVGETGCGKSTQVPQFVLEENPLANLVVTQPRRICALALAHRVAAERGEDVGQTVGYSVHLESRSSSATRVLFCTNGVFRRRLLADPQLESVTHLVLDELHERDKVADFLLIAIRDLLTERPHLRLILMSATMQHETFRRYFPGCVEVRIDGRVFPVHEYFLEDVAPWLHKQGRWKALGPGFAAGGLGYGSWGGRGGEKAFKFQILVSHVRDVDNLYGYAHNARHPLTGSRFDEGLFLHDVLQQSRGVHFDLPIVEELLSHLSVGQEPWLGAAVGGVAGPGMAVELAAGCTRVPGPPVEFMPEASRCGSCTLVFLPGWDDIDRLRRRLLRHPVLGDSGKFWVLPLHSQIRLEQQREVFRRPPTGVRKIVLSTNIAESSLTIDDVDVVIDCGRVKETSYDAFLGVSTLNTSWVSRASMAQRAGRAGRTTPGACYHVFSRRRADLLDAHRPPEILRSALDEVCLHAKLVLTQSGQLEESASSYLRRAPDPPNERNVTNAETLLCEIGALTCGSSHAAAANPFMAGQLTALGTHLSAVPLTPQLAKVLLWANLLGVGEGALAIVSGLQYREPFVGLGDMHGPVPLSEANRSVRDAKRLLCGLDFSDHIALLRACEGFEAARRLGGDHAREFCQKYTLSFKQMHTLRQTSAKLRSELQRRRLWSVSASRCEGDTSLLGAALCAGLFPNVAYRANGARLKLKVSGGRLDALPHSSSVASFTRGGEDLWEKHAAAVTAAAGRVVDDQGCDISDEAGEAGGCWLCFNELSQVEDHYSLSGLTPVPLSALLLLCGEGDLVIRSADGASSDNDNGAVRPQDAAAAVSDVAFARWWEAAGTATNAADSTKSRRGSEDVVVSVAELGEWFAVRLRRETSNQLQALRAMLRFLFRVFCGDPSRWQELTGEGQVGSVVLDLASRIIHAEAGGSTGTKAEANEGAVSTASGEAAPVGIGAHDALSSPHQPRTRTWASRRAGGRSAAGGTGSGTSKGGRRFGAVVGVGSVSSTGRTSSSHSNNAGAAQRAADVVRQRLRSPQSYYAAWGVGRPCGSCGFSAAEAEGCEDLADGVWYCFGCWQAYCVEAHRGQGGLISI